MSDNLVNPQDSLERQNEKLLTIAAALMRRIEQGTQNTGLAYAQFQRAVMLEEEVRSRTSDLERTLELLNVSNAQLAQANAETEAARSNLANAIETVQEGFALFDPQDRLVMCNRRFGKHLKDVYQHFKPGLSYADYVTMVSISPYLKLPEKRTPEQWAEQRMMRHKDDHVMFNARMSDRRWLQISEHRTADGGTVVLQTDVTEMVRLERRERDRLLDDQARLIRATLEHLNQGICIFDSENRLVVWNYKVGDLLSIPVGRFHIGTPFDTLLKQLKREFFFADEAAVERIESWIEQPNRTISLSFEFRTKGNRDLTAFAQHMPDNGFVISFTDVTVERAAVQALSEANETLERRVAERTLELEDALGEAERANASKTRFVAAASHDLLQPLSAAKLYISSLENAPMAEELQNRLTKANNALQSVENIIAALLDISKLDSGKVAVNITDVSLGRLLSQLKDEFDPIARKKGLKLVFVPTDVVVRGDTAFLRRIVQNLVSNAIRYTDFGGVLVGLRHHKDTVSLEVWDTGLGIPEDQQERIFDEFHRLNTSNTRVSGMGLGLAIVDRACRLLEYPLQLQSTLHKGSKFTITLPRSTRPNKVERQSQVFKTDRTTNIQGAIVLLIENELDLRNAIAVTIENWGAGVFSCASEAEAITLLEEVDIIPDIIVTDHQLDDGLFGTDAISNLKKRFGPIPSCLITANPSKDLMKNCEDIGIDLFSKPLVLPELLRFLQQSVEKNPTNWREM